MNLNEIIHKEDSAERLAAVAGIDPKYLQSAEEFNCIVDNLKEIHNTLRITPAGQLLVFKIDGNEDNAALEVGDFCMGFIEGQFINANYIGELVRLV